MMIRPKGDNRFYAPASDLRNCMVYMMRGAVVLCEAALKDNNQKLEDLGKLALIISDGTNEAKRPTSGTAMQVLQKVFDQIRDIDKEVQLIFMSNFMYIVMCRYITAMRGTESEKDLAAKDILELSVTAAMVMHLPSDIREQATDRMRDRNKWGPLDDTGIYEQLRTEEVPPDASKQGG